MYRGERLCADCRTCAKACPVAAIGDNTASLQVEDASFAFARVDRRKTMKQNSMNMKAAILSVLLIGAVASAHAAKVPIWGGESKKWIEGGREFFVSPDGKPENPGTREAPWDLRSTLEGKHELKGGDVIWVTGGTYKGCFTATLNGAEVKPIIIGGKQSAARILVKENLGWANGMGRHCEFGYMKEDHKDIRLIDNYFAGQVTFKKWEKIAMTGKAFNVFVVESWTPGSRR